MPHINSVCLLLALLDDCVIVNATSDSKLLTANLKLCNKKCTKRVISS